MPLIAIEGPDGCGKSTLAQNLANEFSITFKNKWHLVTDPSIGDVGRLIRKFLASGAEIELDALGYLHMADRIHNFPRDGEQYRVITDRYLLSTLIYQSFTMPKHVLASVLADPRVRRPDVTIVLMADPDTCLERLKERSVREAFEHPDQVYKMCAAYHAVGCGIMPQSDGPGGIPLMADPQLQYLAAGRIIPIDITGMNKATVSKIAFTMLRPWIAE